MLSKNRFHALSDLNCDLEISTHMTPEHPSLPAAAGIADFKASKGLVVGPPVGGTETVLDIANRATPPSSPDEGEKKLDNGIVIRQTCHFYRSQPKIAWNYYHF